MKALRAEAKRRGEDLVTTEGSDHTKVSIDGTKSVVPRHNEITAKAILKQMGVRQ